MRRLAIVAMYLALAFAGLALITFIAMRGSLPALDGERAVAGLAGVVTAERDAQGTLTLQAGSQADMARALGFVHAQERYFEMDLGRRSAAGELAALFGPAALQRDLLMRPHRLRARATAMLADLPADQRQLLDAYVEGVNAGLSALNVRPWAYLPLRQRPQPWLAEDSLLVALAMYADLQMADLHNEPLWHQLREFAPPALATLLGHAGSRHDAPLWGPPLGDARLPPAQELDLRHHAAGAPAAVGQHAPSPGSNNFAVAGSLTADGRAIVADDMHLGLRAPNIWFRARLTYPHSDAPGGQVDVTGFTLPGLPAVIVGSNGHVAWGFTNSYIDNADYARYDAASLARPGTVTEFIEHIAIAGQDSHALSVRQTAFGPLTHSGSQGSALALRWTAHLPGAVNLGLADMAHAANLEQAFAVADRTGVPAQNLVIGDASGRIAWRLIGTRPDRAPGCLPGVLVDMSGQTPYCPPWPTRTDGAPHLLDPDDGRLWTANSRVVASDTLAVVGDGGYDLGARAAQIRDGLGARAQFTEADLLAIQLDDRALLLEPWYGLMRQTVEGSTDPALQRLEAASRQWEGRASVDSVSYRLARGFRGITLNKVQAGLLAPIRQALDTPDWHGPALPQLEGIVWPLLEQRPPHLLPPGHASWDDLLASVASELVADLDSQGPDLSQRTWGERSTARICHPLQMAQPLLTRWLCMPAEGQPGDNHMPRVAAPSFGASQRMVVAPGHEADGIVHMPGGQSGHPLSPFWAAGHADWAKAAPSAFLPGAARHTLALTPAR